MKNLLLFTHLCLLGLGNTAMLSAQDCNPIPKNLTTHPANPVNTERPDKLNTFFDWRKPIYQINSSFISESVINSPWNDVQNPIMLDLVFNQDMKPEDGWELLHVQLGYKTLNDGSNGTTPESPKVKNPMLVMYNKYTSIMRVLAAVGDSPDYTGARLLLMFHKKSEIYHSTLDFGLSEFKALDDFQATDKNPQMVALSPFSNNSPEWFYADFVMQYDPCTCDKLSGLMLKVELISKSNITMTGTTTGTLTNIENNDQGGINDDNVEGGGASFSFSWDKASKVGQNALKIFNDIGKFKDAQFNVLTKYKQQTDYILAATAGGAVFDMWKEKFDASQANSLQKLDVVQKALSKSKLLRNGLKAAPYIAAAFTLVDMFIGGGKKPAEPQEVKIMPMAINTTTKYTGEIEASYQYQSGTFWTPGSYHLNNPAIVPPLDTVQYPIYNKTMGVFNLLRSPSINYIHGSRDLIEYPATHLNCFQLLKDVEYVVNPEAGFKIPPLFPAPDIMGQFVIELEQPTAIYAVPAEMGDLLMVASPYLLQTRELPLSRLKDLPFMFSYVGNFKVYLKLTINLERIDADENTQNTLYVLKYPIKFNPMTPPDTYGVGFFIWALNQTNTPFSTLKSIPIDRIINNNDVVFPPTFPSANTITKDKLAWRKIDVISGVENITIKSADANTQVSLMAGESISIKTKDYSIGGSLPYTIKSVQILPNTVLEIGDVTNTTTLVNPMPYDSIRIFCNSTKYLEKRAVPRHSEEVSAKTKPAKNVLLNYPNPTSALTTIAYSLAESSDVELYVSNVLGERVAVLVQRARTEAGQYEIVFDTSTLPAGVYFYTLQTATSRETKRLVVSK
jgi:hypothetical protein